MKIESQFGRTLVIAPHPDDEVLGAGGTIARLAASDEQVTVAVVTTGRPPDFPAEMVKSIRAEAKLAHQCLGVHETLWLDQPAAQLSETPTRTLNAAILDAVRSVDPDTLLVPFVGDIHIDHQLIFQSALVAARPHQAKYPRTILAYETVSETNWNAPYVTASFVPNLYVEIDGFLDKKIEAMRCFASQLRAAPHERSVETLTALARCRGATIHRAAAEAFVLIRHSL